MSNESEAKISDDQNIPVENEICIAKKVYLRKCIFKFKN